jgi:hypothetical protein
MNRLFTVCGDEKFFGRSILFLLAGLFKKSEKKTAILVGIIKESYI